MDGDGRHQLTGMTSADSVDAAAAAISAAAPLSEWSGPARAVLALRSTQAGRRAPKYAVPASCRGCRRRFWCGALCLALVLGGNFDAAAQEAVASRVDVVLNGETYVIHASARLAADQRLAWETLTDYERLRDFVPGVTRARVLQRSDTRLIIEQSGVFTVLFVELPVQLQLAVEHRPYSMVLARLLPDPVGAAESTLRSFTASYRLRALARQQQPGVQLDYDASFELAQPLPSVLGRLFGVGAVRRAMREQFEAMLREIERRQAALTARELVD